MGCTNPGEGAGAWQAVHSHLGAAVDSVHREIEAVLTPAQRSEFREWLREENFEQYSGGRGPSRQLPR